ncbi:DUF5713 family protein [Microbulbifer sp. JMSA004]|uniref:DUF5713 family protein n=1 Tax=Microbulbifer sp. JMSA004 TaxID=3243370 RepID=UPI0040397C90
MPISNVKIHNHNFLAGMYSDGYFPDFLVDKIKVILIDLCESIESERPQDKTSLLRLTHAATERINHLAEEFEDNDSELETEAREVMAENFDFVVRAYGFDSLDIEDVIATREW